jgi:methylated-DNA-protein-cysteine methyltransferase-like protein
VGKQTSLGLNPGVGSFTARVVEVVRSIPKGEVATYGQVARLAGNPNGARQVVRVLWSQSDKERLPWHRIISARGHIALTGGGFRMQRSLLKQEGVKVAADGTTDLKRYQWSP